ncbi:MAG: NADPH-dependent F420 reductase [Candidatus Acidiferrales bacterium]
MQADSVAVIGGTGDQGYGLALRWAAAGKRVVIGSRKREKAEEAAARVRAAAGGSANVEGAENCQAVTRAPMVVLTVPFEAQIATLKSIKEHLRPGQTLVDVTVPLEAAVGGAATKLLGVWAGSAAEQAAANVPAGVEVAAAFHNVSASALQDLAHSVDCDVIVCGQSPEARQRLRPWVEAIAGCRWIDGGKLENARTVEAITALIIGINLRYKVPHAGIRITGLQK